MKLLLLSVLFLAYYCKEQKIISSLTSDGSEIELKQIFVYFRHGNYVLDYLFYMGEYDSYLIDPPQMYSPTFLGNSQSWSVGYYLRQLHGDFLEGLDSSNDFLFLMGDYERSTSNAEHISSGLVGNYPDWDYSQIDSVVLDALELNGFCGGCPDTSYVPVSMFTKTDPVNVTYSDNPDLLIMSDTFFDIDENCDYIFECFLDALDEVDSLIENEYGIEIDDDELDEVIDSLITEPDGMTDTIGIEIIIGMYENHVAHELETLELDQSNIQDVLELDLYEWLWGTIYESFFDDDKFMAQLYDSDILDHSLQNLYTYVDSSDEKKVIVYMMHDNNLYAFLQILMESRPEYPYYAENLVIKVFSYIDENGDEIVYVNAYFNFEKFTIYGCDEDCPIDEFYTIVESNVIDSSGFCDTYEEYNQIFSAGNLKKC